jgi:hypothetical protein
MIDALNQPRADAGSNDRMNQRGSFQRKEKREAGRPRVFA